MGQIMEFVFDETKAAQAAAWLLRRYGEPMEAVRLVTLLYLVDRRKFIENGYPLTGDDFVAVQEGPTLRKLRRLASDGNSSVDHPWAVYVRRVGLDRLAHTNADDFDDLSEADRDALAKTLDKHRAITCDQLLALTRHFPEWRGPADTPERIDPSIMLRSAGYSEEEIKETASQVGSIRWLHTTLGQ